MATRTTRAGRETPGVLTGALAALALSAFVLAGCGKAEPEKKPTPAPGGTAGKTDPGKGAITDPAPGGTTPAPGGAAAALSTDPAAYIPKDAFLFVQLRPKRILASDLAKAFPEAMLKEAFEKFDREKPPIDIDFKEIESVTIAMLPPSKEAGPAGDRETAIVVKHSQPLDLTSTLDLAKKEGGKVTEEAHGARKYWRISPPEEQRPLNPNELKRPAPFPPDSKKEEPKSDEGDEEEEEPGSKVKSDPAAGDDGPPPGFNPPKRQPKPKFAAVKLDEKSALIGHETLILKLLDGNAAGPMAARLKGVSLEQDLVIAVFPGADPFGAMIATGAGTQGLPPDAQEKIGNQLETTKAVVIGLDLTGDTLLSVTVESATNEATDGLEAQANTGVQLVKGFYEQMSGKYRLDEAKPEEKELVAFGDKLVAGLAVAKKGNDLSVTIKNPKGWDKLKPVFAMAAKQAEEAAKRAQGTNNLKQIGLATHNYYEVNQSLPPSKVGKGQELSWRVHLLPFLDQPALYAEFNLEEPWDSETNKKLIEKMPAVFKSDLVKEPGKTRIVGFSGEGALFGETAVKSFAGVKDGLSNTILAAEVAPEKAVIWTKPEDAVFDKDDPKAALGDLTEETFKVLLLDGSVRALSKMIDAETFKALITPAGGEEIDRTKLD